MARIDPLTSFEMKRDPTGWFGKDCEKGPCGICVEPSVTTSCGGISDIVTVEIENAIGLYGDEFTIEKRVECDWGNSFHLDGSNNVTRGPWDASGLRVWYRVTPTSAIIDIRDYPSGTSYSGDLTYTGLELEQIIKDGVMLIPNAGALGDVTVRLDVV